MENPKILLQDVEDFITQVWPTVNKIEAEHEAKDMRGKI
jgi:hypothetical protein